MARTKLFDALRRAMRLAWSAERAGVSTQEHIERMEAQRARWLATRRQFLKASAGAAALVGVPTLGAGCGDDGPPDGPEVRVAIVGGGMAGLHCAYRLKQAGVTATVFEAADRTGGRMFSARGMFAEGQVAELGGELIDSNHVTMMGLASELEIQLDDLFDNEPAGFTRDTWYFEGRLVLEAEIVEAYRPLAARMAATITATDKDEDEFARIDAMNILEWLDDEGMVDPLMRVILDDAYTGEYGLESEQQSIFNLLYLIDADEPEPFRIFGDSDERYHTHLGNDTFISKLAAALPGQIELGSVLTAVAEVAGGGYRLTFDQGGTPHEEEFDHVVFALPNTLLREVDLTGVDLPAEKRQLIDEGGYGTNAKIMSGYTSKVWRVEHNASGSALTDNGLQFIWDTARGQDGAAGLLTWFAGGQVGVDMGGGTAEERMAEALPLVDQIFPGAAAAYVANSAVRMHWPTYPFTKGSYACYEPGQWAFWGLEGARVGNLHFCGEHCSLDFQGFMEGACETGALAAAEVIEDLGLQAPAALRRVLGSKLALPQGSYRGKIRNRPRWTERRKLARALTGRRRY